MSEMVERVARAVNAELSRVEELPREDRALGDRQLGDLLARAAMLAMREPTEGMVDAADIADRTSRGQFPGSFNSGDAVPASAKEHWQAMIDEALK